MAKDNQNIDSSCKEIASHIEKSIQYATQIISDFFCNSSEGISISVIEESRCNNGIYNIVAENFIDANPIVLVTVFESNKEISEKIADQIKAFMTACGYDILNSNKDSWKVPDYMSNNVSDIFALMSNNSYFKMNSTHCKENNTWSIELLTENEPKSVNIICQNNLSYNSASIIERQIAILVASMNRTVETKDGVKINIYGCANFPH